MNEARREAGVSEVSYASEMPNAQNAANARAEELSVKYNHTRPSGVIQDLQREYGVSINFSRENIAHVVFIIWMLTVSYILRTNPKQKLATFSTCGRATMTTRQISL